MVPNASIPCYAHHVAITLGHVPHLSTFPQVASQAFGMGSRLGFMVNTWVFQTIQLKKPANNHLGTFQTRWASGPGLHHAVSYSAKHSRHKSEPNKFSMFLFVKMIGDQKSGSIWIDQRMQFSLSRVPCRI